MQLNNKLWQITSKYFCAGIITKNDIVIDAAPILKWTINKKRNFLRNYFKQKNWKVKFID